MENKEMKNPIPVELEEEELRNVSAGADEGETKIITNTILVSSSRKYIQNRTSSEDDISTLPPDIQ